mmetsp:Transcript_25378/g.63646  ORF Transcript_25378/g.63646 Transcript_25378/m.63646 type:complete len:198 (-) Transcript_25378:192-785(-)|eukprot:CAMPEP_0113886696 /NCGR_PEP_ID=MMETSP0780_2-20120614/11716_1 /TAXON_ID=652834 /ORGANISM="Palpitomonas bilix" /LENGTH=197 /DNA_ID=CAMNT_0000874975 /DNA_START=22 /DNA_END=615 /DNA_ORIENTATION=+ /assembly_acc=CAM_ASM_000599
MKVSTLALIAVLALVPLASAIPVPVGESGLVGACKSKNFTDANVDWTKYVGRWFEIGRSKSFYFDHNCYCTTATYTANSDGTVAVDNECRKESVTGKTTGAKGTAETVADHPGRLLVWFFTSLFKAPYDVVYVNDDYTMAAVVSCDGTPIFGGSNVWILAREAQPDQSAVEALKNKVSNMGFDMSDFVMTTQENCWN